MTGPDTVPMSDIPTRATGSRRDAGRRANQERQACLIQYSGPGLGRRHVLPPGVVVIGRGTQAQLVIPDDSVSREHVRLLVVQGQVQAEDLGSSNGSQINGQALTQRTVLRDGDILQLGSVHLKFFSQDSVESAFHDEIFRKATLDVGTQVYNRMHLLESLDTAFAYSVPIAQPLSLIYFDLDHFKRVNDTHGHSCGDHVLRETARVARECVRENDILGRYGGEEFVVVLPGCDLRLAAALAERLRQTVELHTFRYEGLALRQTVSAGVSQRGEGMRTPRDLLDDADRKLYRAKQGGRNRVIA